MAFPIKICSICAEEFELKPDKPGFANRCPDCSAPKADASKTSPGMSADERKAAAELSDARKQAIRRLLYREDS